MNVPYSKAPESQHSSFQDSDGIQRDYSDYQAVNKNRACNPLSSQQSFNENTAVQLPCCSKTLGNPPTLPFMQLNNSRLSQDFNDTESLQDQNNKEENTEEISTSQFQFLDNAEQFTEPLVSLYETN